MSSEYGWNTSIYFNIPEAWVSKYGSSVVDAARGPTMGRRAVNTTNSLAIAFLTHSYRWK